LLLGGGSRSETPGLRKGGRNEIGQSGTSLEEFSIRKKLTRHPGIRIIQLGAGGRGFFLGGQ